MKKLLLQVFLFFFSLLFVGYSSASRLSVSINLTFKLGKNFAKVRKYLIYGIPGGTKKIFGLNHLIKNSIATYNDMERKNKGRSAELIEKSFSIEPQIDPSVACILFESVSLDVTKKALKEAVDEHRNSFEGGCCTLSIHPSAYLLENMHKGLDVVQAVSVNGPLNDLISAIKKKLNKYKIKYKLPEKLFVTLAKIAADDFRVIGLIEKNAAISNHIKSVRVPNESDNIVIDQIQLCDGTKFIESYTLTKES